MDRELSVGFRRRRRIGQWLRAAGLLTAAGFLAAMLPGWLQPGLRRAEIRTARVERGPVDASLQASGTVVSAFEKVVSSPLEARVLRVLRRAGEAVRAGDALLELDTTALAVELERLEDRLAQKANEQEQLRLELERRLIELGGQLQTQKADRDVIEYRWRQQRKLREQGITSQEALLQAEAESRKARIQLEQLEKTIDSERRTTAARLQGLELDLRILGKERDEARRQMDLATARSDRDGVLTWIVTREGSTVRRGEELARIADLGSFRVEATVSDVHAARLAPGLRVRVETESARLGGTLDSVDPTIENGAVKFTVALDEAAHQALRNNLRVDVHVITGSRKDTPRLRRGAFVRGGAVEQVYVVRGDQAVRTEVRLGLTGAEHVEVLDGLQPGDEVVLTDMRDHAHLDRLRLR